MNDLAPPPHAPKFALLTHDKHAGVRVAIPRRFPDAVGLGSFPLFVAELAEASAHFPIVFVGGDTLQLTAVLAVAQNENLFVNPDGTWIDGGYIPALLRRRPFSITRTDKPETFAIMIDENDATLTKGDGVALFDGDKPSALGEDFLKLVRELQPATALTEAFVKAVQERGLVIPRVATLTSEGRQPAVLQGMQMIDPAKLAALPEATVVEWHRNGYLAAIAYIIGSQGRWQSLLRLVRLRDGARG